LTVGQNDCGAWAWKYATAISPDRMNATGRVKKPSRMASPPNVSSTPASPISEISGTGSIGMGGGGNANSLVVPARMNVKPAMMRSTLSTRSRHGDASKIDMLASLSCILVGMVHHVLPVLAP
jgi:hypothetical protein